MTKRFGFTLAEVLITLGIIGVVAAMTMPTLINQTNGAQYKAAYKKALSAISQGVTLNVALEDVSFADATKESTNTNVEAAATKDLTIAGFLSNRMNVVNTIYNGSNYNVTKSTNGTSLNTGDNAQEDIGTDSNTVLYFNDSSVFSFPNDAKLCKQDDPCKGLIDVNGAKGPNKQTVSGSNPTDIYPVKFYDQTILPNSQAATEVLYGK